MATLYRAMRKEYDDRPMVLSSASVLSPARGLGVRPEVDIPVDEDGYVGPGEDGMSVVQDSPEHLEDHRRPRWLDGESDDPLWRIEEEQIGDALNYRLDEPPPCHGVIEPAWRMPLDDYEIALAETRDAWTECPQPVP